MTMREFNAAHEWYFDWREQEERAALGAIRKEAYKHVRRDRARRDRIEAIRKKRPPRMPYPQRKLFEELLEKHAKFICKRAYRYAPASYSPKGRAADAGSAEDLRLAGELAVWKVVVKYWKAEGSKPRHRRRRFDALYNGAYVKQAIEWAMKDGKKLRGAAKLNTLSEGQRAFLGLVPYDSGVLGGE